MTDMLSLFIEIFQFFTPRATDIDDVILNSFGGLLGAVLYLFFSKLFGGANARVKRPRKPVKPQQGS